MDEILQKLLESELLTEDAKTEIKSKFSDFVEEVKQQTQLEVKTQLTEEFIAAREELAKTLEAQVDNFLNEEITELRGDLESFRDLEIEYAEKLLEEKKQLAVQLGEELDQLVDKLDAFLEVRLSEELSELAEDIELVKRDTFGRKIFESFANEYSRSFIADKDGSDAQIAELTDRLADAEQQIVVLESANRKQERTRKLDELLAPLTGTKLEHMKLLLSNVTTSKLEEAFNRYIGRVLKEADTTVSADKTLTEEKVKSPAGKVVTGNEQLTEELKNSGNDEDVRSSLIRLKQLAGI